MFERVTFLPNRLFFLIMLNILILKKTSLILYRNDVTSTANRTCIICTHITIYNVPYLSLYRCLNEWNSFVMSYLYENDTVNVFLRYWKLHSHPSEAFYLCMAHWVFLNYMNIIVMCLYVYSLPNYSEFHCTLYREKKSKIQWQKEFIIVFSKTKS